MSDLTGKRIAILVTDGFEQVELTSPREALDAAGAKTELIAPGADKVKGWNHTDWGDEFKVDVRLKDADASDYDALVLPGGTLSPDKLRTQEPVQKFVRDFFKQQKPVGAICHGPWTLINANVAKGRQLTSYHSIRLDLENAGAQWVDQEVVVDNGLITSRNPDDLDAFNKALVENFAEACSL